MALRRKTPKFNREIKEKQVYGNNIKFIFDNDCWALLRFSGTEPLLRVFVEAESRVECDRIMKILKNFVSSCGENDEKNDKIAI